MAAYPFLEYGATGLVMVIILIVLAPTLRSFANELKEGREERKQMREEQVKFAGNHAQHTTDALIEVKTALAAQTELVRALTDGVNHTLSRMEALPCVRKEKDDGIKSD